MLVFFSIVSVGLLGMIIYFAFAPGSSRLLKLVAVIALGVITLALMICGIMILVGPKEQVETAPFPNPFTDGGQQASEGIRILDIIIFLVIMAIMGLVLFKAYKDQKKMVEPMKKAAAIPAFSNVNDDDLDSLELGDTGFGDDESFDLGLDE